MNKTKKIKFVYASTSNVFGRKLADFLIHAFLVLNFGKTSLKEIDDDELNILCDWAAKIANEEGNRGTRS